MTQLHKQKKLLVLALVVVGQNMKPYFDKADLRFCNQAR